MDGLWSTRKLTGRRWGRVLPCAVLVVCLLTAGNVFSVDIFSLVYPQASGTEQLSSGKVVVDISNNDKGYIMVRHDGSQKRLKTRITYGDQQNTYDQNGYGEYETYPLQYGSGSYKIEVFENVKDSDYSSVFNKSFTADMANPNAAFLCPNQYVWYTPSTAAVAKSFEICEGIEGDMDKAKALYNYVGDTVIYDYMKAITVQKGYLPSIDDTLNTKMGICFDYAALLACMMRVQGIPTQLVIGTQTTMNQYHAWNVAYIDGSWILLDPTFKNSNYSTNDYKLERYY